MKNIFALLLVLLAVPAVGQDLRVVDLKCDYRETPLAVDRVDPVLSWRMEGERQGLAQRAYQIQAATSASGLDSPDLWDTGWVESQRSTGIVYAGEAFDSKQRVYWRVRVRDEAGAVQAWSEPTWFEGGLHKDADWQGAQWISCTRQIEAQYADAGVMGDWLAAGGVSEDVEELVFAYDFELPDKPVVYAGAWWNHVEQGKVLLTLNGQKGGGFTEGEPTVYFEDFGFFMQQDNRVRITLSGAKTDTPISFGMHIVFADGSEQRIQSGEGWTVRRGEASQPAEVVGRYGEAPFGEAMIAPRSTLDVAWYKKDFDLQGNVASARLYLCGLGYSEPYLNGEKVGDHVLDPGQTDYDQIAHYQTFDVKDHLKAGGNALSILLGDGWYNNDRMFSKSQHVYGKPGLRAYLDIRYEDGSTQRIVSDPSWAWSRSGVSMSNLFLGDHIDYRDWHDEWKTPGGSDAWSAVRVVGPLSPKLVAQDFPPIRVVRVIEPIKTWQVGEKTWVVDLGQNISGWIGMDLDEPAGTVVRIRCSEMLEEDGVHLANAPGSFQSCHAAPQHHRIISDGTPRTWRPFFSYHGFRFAEIHGLSKAPEPGQIRGMVVNTDAPRTARFASSEPMLDRIFEMGIQTHYNNMHSILEDCPHREKCLWGGDLHSSWAAGFYTMDSATFYRQQVNLFYTPPFDPRGIPGRIGVGKRSTNRTLDFTWSVSPLFLAYRNYQINGEVQTLETHYDVMRRFLKFTEGDSTNLLPNIHRYGDHAPPIGVDRVPADSQLIAGLNFFAAAKRFAIFADVLGKQDDAQWSKDLANRIGQSIIDNHYDREHATLGNGTHDSLALAFGLFEGAEADRLANTLAQTYIDNGKQFDGGFMSYFIYPELTKAGHVDLALDMLLNPDYPGIAQSIRDYDATTIFERFRNDGRRRQLQQSLNHHATNHPTGWMLNDLAGIRIHPDTPGPRRLLLQPAFPARLDFVKAEMQTAYGVVRSAWDKDGRDITWTITIPPNAEAEIRLPNGSTDIQRPADDDGQSGEAFNLPAGEYTIRFKLPV